jgi:hypothetical protein
MDPEALSKILSNLGWIDADDVGRLLKDYESGSLDLFDFLEASGVGSKRDILQAVAEARGTEFVDLGKVEFPPKLFDSIPDDIIRIYRSVPIHDSSDLLKVCLKDPLDDAAVDELANLLKRRIRVVIADPDAVEELVQNRLEGSLNVSPSFKTAPVAASLGTDPDGVASVLHQSRKSGLRMVGLALLAASAAATAALYLGQQVSANASDARFEQFEALLEAHRLSRLAVEQEIRDLERELEKLTVLLNRNEVDAIKLVQLEAGIHQLEGKVESLNEIQARVESSTGTDENPNGTKE